MKRAMDWMLRIALVGLILSAPALRAADDDAPQIAKGAKEYMVEMRDGVRLATNVFLPKSGDGPWPVILTRTPYGKDGGMFAAMPPRYLLASYVFVAQDCRGKFRSEGDYQPFQTAMEDGYDTVEWIAEQPWSNGKVGMGGASAMGITTNMAASANPPHLVAGFAVVAPESLFEEATFIAGVFKEADVGNWMRNQGAGDQVAYRKSRVLLDEEWTKIDFMFNRDKVDIPIYNIGGWYDIFSKGNVHNFAYLQNKGMEGARGNQKLMMGPFGHGQLSGEMEYPEAASLMSAFNEEIRWFDYWLKGERNGVMDEPRIKYYMMASARKGAASEKNGWRTAENWPLDHEKVRYYLGEDRALDMKAPSASKASTTYAFDPDPEKAVPTVGGANLTLPLGPMDQRAIESRPDYLRFQTPPLIEDVVIGGPVSLELYVSTDAPDTDFMAKLVDVYPDGYEALILDSPIRLRYRNGRRPENVKMMKPGKIEKVVIDLWNTANTFEKGHRIAVHISSSNYPRFELNANNGEAPGGGLEPRIANNTIHHDASHLSALVLPVLAE